MQSSPNSDGTSAKPETQEPAPLGLRRGDQLFVGVCIFIGLILLAIYTYGINGWGQPPIEIERLPARQYDYQLDINRANWIEWSLLEGIGEKLGKRIVSDRDERGPFRSIEDLDRVEGIGEKTIERIRPWLTIRTDAAPDSPN